MTFEAGLGLFAVGCSVTLIGFLLAWYVVTYHVMKDQKSDDDTRRNK